MTKLTTKKDVQQATNAANIIPTTRTAFRSVRTTVPVWYDDDVVACVERRPARLGTASTPASWNTARCCCCCVTAVWNGVTGSTSAAVVTAVMGTSLSVSDGTLHTHSRSSSRKPMQFCRHVALVTLTFELLTSRSMDAVRLSCTVCLPHLVLTAQTFLLLERGHTHRHSDTQSYSSDHRTHVSATAGVFNNKSSK